MNLHCQDMEELGEVIVRVEDVLKRFGEVRNEAKAAILAVDHVSIEVFAGEFFSILGPSGCGKTTLLRLIAGLEEPDSGMIYLSGKPINSIPPYRRDVNMVFQNYALFPHMNVYENVAFGLKVKKIKKSEISERVFKALELVELSHTSLRKPTQLSGGQQQRVALARALVNEPSVLLLDEPLGALDLRLRKQMQMDLKSLQKRLGITFIYVTHDQEEALTMSDRIAIMHAGKLDQVGNPSQVYDAPKTRFVADFIGISNLFEGDLRSGEGSTRRKTKSPGFFILKTPDGIEIKAASEHIPSATTDISLPQSATVMVRPEKIQITPFQTEFNPVGNENLTLFRGKIEEIVYLGTVIQFIVNLKGKELVVLEKNYGKALDFVVNQEVFVSWDISSAVILPGR